MVQHAVLGKRLWIWQTRGAYRPIWPHELMHRSDMLIGAIVISDRKAFGLWQLSRFR